MAIYGDVGTPQKINFTQPGLCAVRDDYDEADLEGSLALSLASDGQHIGIDLISGTSLWYPTGTTIECQEPAFVILNKAYGLYNAEEKEFYLNASGNTRVYEYKKTPNLEVDERTFMWSDTISYDSNTYNVTSRCINESLGLPASLKLSIAINEDKTWDDFGIKYILNPQIPMANYLIYQSGTAVEYPANVVQNIPSSNLDPFTVEFWAIGLSSKMFGYFDFDDLFDGAVTKYIKTEWVTFPDTTSSGLCLVIGATKGSFGYGAPLEIDPQLGNSAWSTYGTWSYRACGIRILASSQSDTVTGIKLNSMTVYGRSSTGTKEIEGAIYSCNSITSGCMDFLYSTTRSTHNTTAAWRTLTFAEPQPVIESGTKYYICWGGSGIARYYYSTRDNFAVTGAKGWSDAVDWWSPLPASTIGYNNKYFAIYLDYTPVGEQSSKMTKIGSPTEWTWGYPTLGIDSSQVSTTPSGLFWEWSAVSNAGTRWIKRSGAEPGTWEWVQENS